MKFCHIHQIDRVLTDAASRYEFVLVPGLYDSDAEHWQTHWQQRMPFWKRVNLRKWDDPYIERWTSAISNLLLQCERPAVLVGHSFGALASCCVARDLPEKVAGLMLVAPAEPFRFGVEDMVPEFDLEVPGVVVASYDDPLMTFRRAEHWAQLWGSELIDLGEAGHINSEAGFGSWFYGLEILRDLSSRVDRQRTATIRQLMNFDMA